MSQGLYSLLSRSDLYDIGSHVNGHDAEAGHAVRSLPFDSRHDVHNVLSLGCGTGTFDAHAAKRFPHARITSVDMNADMVARLQAKAEKHRWAKRLRTMVGDVRVKLAELKDERFDLIMATGLLEYISEPGAVIDPARELLGPDGLFLNSVVKPTLAGKFVGKVAGMWPSPREKNVKMFTDRGFDLDRIIEVPPTLPLAWIRMVKEAHVFRKKDS